MKPKKRIQEMTFANFINCNCYPYPKYHAN